MKGLLLILEIIFMKRRVEANFDFTYYENSAWNILITMASG